jgi:hypothetical protein
MVLTKFTRKLLIFFFLCLSIRAIGQGTVAAQFSMDLSECLDQGCGTPVTPISWTISGGRGIGHYPLGNQSQLTLEHLDSRLIAVRSRGTTGATRNISALYMGRIDGNQIKGVALYYQGSDTQPSVVAWQGVVTQGSLATVTPVTLGDVQKYPFTLHECEGHTCTYADTPFSIAWTFASRIGQGWLDDHPRPMVLEDLSPGFLLVRRSESNASLTAYYFGEIKGKQINGGTLYYDSGNLDHPRFDMWFGQIQNTFTPEVAMNTPETPAPGPIRDPVPPKQMLLCSTGLCMALTLNGDHYTGIYDGESDHPRTLKIQKWDGRSFTLTSLSSVGKPEERQYSAQIAAAGWYTNSGTELAGTGDPVAFSAVWANLRNTGEYPHRSKMYPNIELPPGASEKYAAYTPQIRLVLMSDPDASPTKADLLRPCSETRLVTNGSTAVEIARYAFRADELNRGNCWTARAVALGDATGETLASLALMMGWSGKVDSTDGCRKVQAIGNRDVWAMLLLSSCYAGYIGDADGFPKDDKKANEIIDLLNSTEHRALLRFRSDDLEYLRGFDRQAVIDNPPMKTVSNLTGDRNSGTCKTDYNCRVYGTNPTTKVVDQDELQRRLREIDDRYARMP